MGILGTLRTSVASEGSEVTDGELVEHVKTGDRSAYGVLYERHAPGARRFARSLGANDADADDVVAEVFAAVLSALERGKGPTGSFAPYLMSSIRHECYRTSRRGARESTDRFAPIDVELSAAQQDPYDGVDEAAVVRVAFESLPDHLREVLWRTEVDELSPTELADGNGGSPHAVAMAALRARRALGSAYLHQHLVAERQHRELTSGCRDARPHLANFVRGALSERRRRRVQQHLEQCPACDEARQGLGRMNRHLKAVPLLPLHLGSLASGSVGVKAQIVAWLSAEALPITTAGMVAVAVLSPIQGAPPEPSAQAAPPAATSTAPAAGTASAAGGGETNAVGGASGEIARGPVVAGDDVAGDRAVLAGPFARWISRPPTAAGPLAGTLPAALPARGAAPPADAGLPTGTEQSVPLAGGPGGAGASIDAAVPGVARGTSGQGGPSSGAPGAGGGASPVGAPPAVPEDPAAGTPPVRRPGQVGNGVPAPVTNNGNAGAPGQATGNGRGNAGAPGQASSTGNGNAGAPGQASNNGNGNAGAPGQASNNGNAGAPTQLGNAGAPGQANGNANGHAGAPGQANGNSGGNGKPAAPGQATNNGNGNGTAAAPGQSAGRGNGTRGVPAAVPPEASAEGEVGPATAVTVPTTPPG